MTDINIGNWKTIEIFRAGTHTAMEGQEISFSDEDIDNMAAAYNAIIARVMVRRCVWGIRQ